MHSKAYKKKEKKNVKQQQSTSTVLRCSRMADVKFYGMMIVERCEIRIKNKN